jgi:hypothetical protein
MILLLLWGAIIGVSGIGALAVAVAFVMFKLASRYSKCPDNEGWLKSLLWVFAGIAAIAAIVVGFWSLQTVGGMLHSLDELKTVH